ncbi:MAG: menaquinone biosynthesis protein [Phycisphaerales bacterium]|nr:menaquinone biosynthesis protein [Phycisphaerales bacterium]
MDTTVRIGYVKYLNTLPLVEGLAAWKQASLIAAVPSRLIDMLLAEPPQIDLGLISVIDSARAATPVALIPVGMIGSDGPTLTVRLFSRLPFHKITSIHADTDSHTSIALVRVLLARLYNIPRGGNIIDYDARERMPLGSAAVPFAPSPHSTEAWPDAMLLIGDKVVTDAPPEHLYPHQLDLGEAWRELTGLPFVYATWMCRAHDASSPHITAAAHMLERARLRNRARLDWIVGRHAAERRWNPELAAEYLGSRLRFDVGERERAAVELFLRAAAALGLCPDRPPVWAAPALPTPALV